MKLRGIDFGPVWGASGVQGFFGEGYRHHWQLEPFGLSFRGCTFVSKTATLLPRAGNMPLKDDYTPKEIKPKCVVVKFLDGVALNSVGLSNPGLAALLETGKWQQRKEPFAISVMSVSGTVVDRLDEFKEMVQVLKRYKPGFRAPFALQINFSCPNLHYETIAGIKQSEPLLEEPQWEVKTPHTTFHANESEYEVIHCLETAAELKVPLIPKFSITTPHSYLWRIVQHPECDALCVSNTVPFGAMPRQIPWEKYFGSNVSPLAHLGGGGLSGKPLLNLVVDWIINLRLSGVKIPVNAGGGILGPKDVSALARAGANSVFVGSIAILRPWRVQRTIDAAYEAFSDLEKVGVLTNVSSEVL